MSDIQNFHQITQQTCGGCENLSAISLNVTEAVEAGLTGNYRHSCALVPHRTFKSLQKANQFTCNYWQEKIGNVRISRPIVFMADGLDQEDIDLILDLVRKIAT